MYRLKIILAILTFFVFTAGTQVPAVKTFHISGYAQGTTYHITYYAATELVTKAHTDSILSKIDSSLSLYKSYSLISRFNRSANGLLIDPHFKNVVEKSLEIWHLTDGLFDITVQPLVEAWGFSAKQTHQLPTDADIKALLPCIGSEKIHLKGRQLTKDKPCVRIDVNGIAQGYSVDVVADFMEAKGIRDYIVEIGGELRVKGHRQPEKATMTIGIEAPGESEFNEMPYQRIMQVSHGAVTTSGNYRKFYQSGAKKINHLIDPHTGYSFQNELISVTVWAKDAITADGYDNALMGMGLKKAMQFVAKKKDMEAYFIYQKPNGAVADTATAGFYSFFKKE